MKNGVFVGFGFGPIQGGLFLHEAFRSGNFCRLVVAEIAQQLVTALQNSRGRFAVNVATRNGLECHTIGGVEAYNPSIQTDSEKLVAAVAEATELATALPSVDFYDKGSPSVATILAAGLSQKIRDPRLPRCVLYAAENHNHAAEILLETIRRKLSSADTPAISKVFQPLNTVIGKMSRAVTDAAEIEEAKLTPITPDLKRAFLVEEFNRILISRVEMKNFQRGISVFEEKGDLLPFEEAKLYGHNAVHALIGYLAHRKGFHFISDAADDAELMTLAREAFLEESGRALIARRRGVDALFTEEGYRNYADDLLERMVNPWLRDAVERVIRDPRRKLGWDDRFIGTMRLALDAGMTPRRFAQGAVAALDLLAREEKRGDKEELLDELWSAYEDTRGRKPELKKLILSGRLDF